MNTNSNTYTFIYASIMVIVVAAGLSFTALKLQPVQEKNVRAEKMQDILSSVGIESDAENAEQIFNKHITKRQSINYKGKIVQNKTNKDEISANDAFNINLKVELRKKDSLKMQFPIFEAILKDSTVKTVIPLLGKGLWGPIWGYVSFNKDFNTIYGAVFDHKAETPGLGADINKDWFEKPFAGKTIFNENGKFISVTVHKGGKGAAKRAEDTEHGVDAISGGTITSKALEKMLYGCLKKYKPYFKKHKK